MPPPRASRAATARAAPGREEVLEAMIDLELLAQTAQAEKIEVASAELDGEIAAIKAQFETPDAFQTAAPASPCASATATCPAPWC